jgi:NAD-dependent deacetylase sirtuin 2
VADEIFKAKSIVVMLGAGVSVNAGIPDFRSPGSGLYDNLQKYDLPFAEAIFDIEYFQKKPDAFYTLCRELWPGIFKPTPTHHFIRLLYEKGRLSRCLTQNIDSLETLAGLPKSSVIAAHGNFDGATCITTGEPVDPDELREAVFGENEDGNGWFQLKQKYGGLVKPDIVFFGESMPPRFFASATTDLPACDLLLVLGSSLQVFPFAGTLSLSPALSVFVLISKASHHTHVPFLGLVHEVPATSPRILINRARAGEGTSRLPTRVDVQCTHALSHMRMLYLICADGRSGGVNGGRGSLDFQPWVQGQQSSSAVAESGALMRGGGDAWLRGDCDEVIERLCHELGWTEDLEELIGKRFRPTNANPALNTQYDPQQRSTDANTQHDPKICSARQEELVLEEIHPGDGKTFPTAGDKLSMHYTGTLMTDGSKFDSSRDRGAPFEFTIGVGQVITGWDEGVMQMCVGQRANLKIPAAMGYGARGAGAAIPPDADLAFDVELLAVNSRGAD